MTTTPPWAKLGSAGWVERATLALQVFNDPDEKAESPSLALLRRVFEVAKTSKEPYILAP